MLANDKILFFIGIHNARRFVSLFFIALLLFGVYHSNPVFGDQNNLPLNSFSSLPSFCDDAIIRPDGPHGALILQPFGPNGITVENPFPPAGPIIIKSDGLGIGSELVLNGELPAYRQDDVSITIELGSNFDPTDFVPFHRDKKIILEDGTIVTIFDDYRFGQIDIVKPSVDGELGNTKLIIRHGGFGNWEAFVGGNGQSCPPIPKKAISNNCESIRIRPGGPHGPLIIQPFGEDSFTIKNDFPPTGPIEIKAFEDGKIMKFISDELLPLHPEDDVVFAKSIPIGFGRDGYVLFLDDQVRASLEHVREKISITSPGLVGSLWPIHPPQVQAGINPLGFGMERYMSYFDQSGIVMDKSGFGELTVTIDPLLFRSIPADDVASIYCPPIPPVPLFGDCEDVRITSETSLTIQPFGPNSLVIKKFGPNEGSDSELHIRPYITHPPIKFLGNEYNNAQGFMQGSVFPVTSYITDDGTRVDITSNDELKITHPGFDMEIIFTGNGFGELNINSSVNPNVSLMSCPSIVPIDFPILELDLESANQLKTDGNFHDSLIKYNNLIEYDPANLSALIGKGVVLTDLEEYETAQKMFNTALIFKHEHPGAINGLALIELKKGNFENAEILYQSVLNKNNLTYPHATIDALVGMAHIAKQKDRPDYAIFLLLSADEKIVKTSKLNPDPNIPNTTGQIYRSINPPDLINTFEQHNLALTYDPRNVDAHNGLGDYYSLLEDWESAKKEYSISLELSPKNLDALIGMIQTTLALGLIDDAESYYEDAITSYPNHSKLESFEHLD